MGFGIKSSDPIHNLAETRDLLAWGFHVSFLPLSSLLISADETVTLTITCGEEPWPLKNKHLAR